MRIYKRTHASANALKDATWAMDNLGLSFLFNTTYTCSDDSPGDTAGGTTADLVFKSCALAYAIGWRRFQRCIACM